MLGTTFDDLKQKDLPNWGFWARTYLPPLREAMNPIYGFLKHDNDDEGHGSLLELLEMVKAGKVPLALIANLKPGGRDEGPIRVNDALELDSHMERMMHRAIDNGEVRSRRTFRNFRIIKNEFYQREVTKRGRPWSVKQDDVDAAIRSLMDLIFGENKNFACSEN
jgi:hypothetical protein